MKLSRKIILGGFAAAPLSAFAVGPDFSTLTGGVDFTTLTAAILAIATLKVAPKVVMWGSGVVLRMIGK